MIPIYLIFQTSYFHEFVFFFYINFLNLNIRKTNPKTKPNSKKNSNRIPVETTTYLFKFKKN